ncbi:MAG: Galactose-1-phosphate uridylyltransferase [Candidatus Ozemobacter sibiricus]|jgi:UDPglucose--hexose-1-phosphate uridylyltransferase|uniref:Galactose-1-phosphate uridylyltransferase n=1 Tax=Candidatus Ozemobacter sibiricus TaxID=2268124 RepID=A0A367ZMU8_9BACT|nr:MAG: Galactose-1-phosphate uridylyltransferase [Candidatus Ozemobacter sibiricus]
MIRQNPVTKGWVIMAPQRARRPTTGAEVSTAPEAIPDRRGDCPFCKGPEGEDRKPSIILHDERGWYLYVIPNRFPALSPDVAPERLREGGRLAVGGFGLAEVVVESNDHWGYLYKRSAHEVRDLFGVFQSRTAALLKDPRIQQVIVFQNCGPRAGASQPHPHSQIYALPIVPANIRREIECRRQFYDNEGLCPACHELERELHENQRVIFKNDLVVAYCPWASEVPYEIHFLPRRHATCLTLLDARLLDALADAVRTMLCRLISLLGTVDYNLLIDTAPRDERDAPFFHLRVRLMPRLATPAGFEIATGIPVNTVLPENAARELAGPALNDPSPF